MRHWSVVLALVGAGLGSGCIIAAGGGDSNACGSQASFSHVGANDMCYCDAGYTWENPDDETDFDCVLVPGKGSGAAACDEPYSSLFVDECYCDYGYKWCVPDDPNDYTCCLDDAQDSAGGGDDETGDETAGDTGGVEPDPADCTVDNEGVSFCSNTSAMGPEASRYWVCMGGAWVESPAVGDESCIFDGYEFAYGCVDSGTAVEFICGNGPGTACERDSSACDPDGITINYCLYGKLTTDSCTRICMEEGDDMGITYDSGLCDLTTNECFCCDMGQEGCNV